MTDYLGLGSLHPFAVCWRNMHSRCYNESNNRYKNYGAKGISVCERWHTFANFHADMYGEWSRGLQIERKNTQLDYNSTNCIWTTPAKNSQNRTTTKLTEAKVAEIRKLFRPGAAYQEKLAKQLGVSSRMIRYIAAEGAWK